MCGMFKSRFTTALALISVVVAPLPLDCATITCREYQGGHEHDDVVGHCPVKLTPAMCKDSEGGNSGCVIVHVWIKTDDLCNASTIEIRHSSSEEIIRPIQKGTKCKKKQRKPHEERVKCGSRVSQPQAQLDLWELVYDCVQDSANSVVTVSYKTSSTSCSVSYTIPDPIPDFDLSVNQSSKSILVTVEPGGKVKARWCYQRNGNCVDSFSSPITIDPSESRSGLLNFRYLLPCVCVQVFYTHTDARRHKKCPFQNKSHTDVRDVWLSSEVSLYESSLNWSSKCPASDLNISASLCWRQNEKLCTPVLNSTLEDRKIGLNLIYNTSAVDKHPQMCLQLSLQGSQEIYCRFEAGMSSWEVYIGPGRQSAVLFITSLAPASFSAQLCVLNERECAPMGQVHSGTIEAYTTKTRIHVPLLLLAEKPCVQVWQSHPALLGRRILCPDYSPDRCGMYAVAALVSVVIVALLGMFIHRLNKSGAAGWLCIREPVLLVCSSEQSAHVSAVCALASILQGELSASVHMALWAQSSQTKNGTEPGTGVADLGPLPWLYGQWEAMREAQGKVLIIWSPEATETYEKWREERANVQRSKRNMREEVEEVSRGRLGKCKREKAAVKKECDDKDWYTQTEPSTVIAPVFAAALACLEGALQECKSQGVALVYFQGLCHSRDIPKAFRGVPRFCLPQDFRGFVQELGGMKRQKRTGKLRWNCLHRLLAKVQSVWLARQLAKRLETLLPQTQGKKTQGPSDTSSLKIISDKTQSRLKLPLAANMARSGTVQEHEPLRVLPW
ncbi:hypothetical protein CesoFtcFv8_011544 [Champsocephalus esox]|uniref:Interleukin 17 receptor E n=1 Tax=Champsocephalus esox TaxID=159716 RepID=A0AAN8C2V5_9TELE|nr:hypothetical protein CesoFtcFv8_011544 [Champsocephalus esox]